MYVLFCLPVLVVGTCAIDCLERLVSEIIHYQSCGMLNDTHLVTVLSSVFWCTANVTLMSVFADSVHTVQCSE